MRQIIRPLTVLLVFGLLTGCASGPPRSTIPRETTPAESLLPAANASPTVLAASVTLPSPPTPTEWAGAPDPAYWPTQHWRSCTPEEQGMDSDVLAAGIEAVARQYDNIHSLVIIRHGYIVTEVYFPPYTPDIAHDLRSATKSFTGALVGIAISEGKIDGVAHKVLDFFPGRTVANLDDRKHAMTLEDLLTMRSGAAWPEWSSSIGAPENPVTRMMASVDWVQFLLDRPMAWAPGKYWNYDSGASHLLSGILQQVTGHTEAAYAQTRLFAPLGITKLRWPADPQGVTLGYSTLHLRPRDMAKFGFLYLHGGRWEDRQVVPADWIRASLVPRAAAATGMSYGYQIWLGRNRAFSASGAGGQTIRVDPNADMVTVITAGTTEDVQKILVDDLALRAVKSDAALPANPAGQARLAATVKSIEGPWPEPVPAMPAAAAGDPGPVIVFEPNARQLVSISLTFPKAGGSEATMHVCLTTGCFDLRVGLDGIYRVTGVGAMQFAARGQWTGERTFAAQIHILGEPGRQDLTTTVAGDTVQGVLRDVESGVATVLKGKQQGK
jgi:CubicO group peptidase (beta-lactamase class C family)